MKHNFFHWNQEGTQMFGQYWEVEKPKGTVVLVHGMGEHSGRYNEFVVPKLNEAGFHVVSFDHFGHGMTKGKRGHCPSYEAVLQSVFHASEASDGVLNPDLPKFLYGHSMGGNVVANYILKREHNFKGAILTSPMLRIAFDPPAWKMAAGKIMKHIYPAFQESTGLDANAISRNKAAVEKYKSDPLVHDKVTVNFSLPFFEAGEWAINHASDLKTPVLLLHGTGDTITSCPASEAFANNNQAMIEFHKFEGAYHELHNEPEKEEVLQCIIDWMNQKLP